jgi:solute:Na+ symporter, SSS family
MIIGMCVAILGLAGVAAVQGAADPRMVLPRIAVEVLPYWIGVLVFVGVLGASMSTANGAMLVISVVLAQNVVQRRRPSSDVGSGSSEPTRGATIAEDSKMLRTARLMALPTAAVAALVAYVRPEPGILLIVAFDIVFAGCVVPLFAGVYWPKANRAGAIASVVVGTSARLIAHFVTPSAWAGLDTLVPPMLSAVTFYATCRLTWKTEKSRHYVLTEAVQEGA